MEVTPPTQEEERDAGAALTTSQKRYCNTSPVSVGCRRAVPGSCLVLGCCFGAWHHGDPARPRPAPPPSQVALPRPWVRRQTRWPHRTHGTQPAVSSVPRDRCSHHLGCVTPRLLPRTP
ncbi:hypothetical protein AAFF_G00051730 [Aldrovandia affinis]|uniref:Uncharacterized protein n=1 Tax=Aldrovandia affinis TaxID=143900 RepID=A0AAD7T5H4_9TELE|nr:hypothetical protein AAFF_G00051730 [Aldrovandia affinis]